MNQAVVCLFVFFTTQIFEFKFQVVLVVRGYLVYSVDRPKKYKLMMTMTNGSAQKFGDQEPLEGHPAETDTQDRVRKINACFQTVLKT